MTSTPPSGPVGTDTVEAVVRSQLSKALGGDMTQREIGDARGISQMQVSRLIRGALERLRAVAAYDELMALV